MDELDTNGLVEEKLKSPSEEAAKLSLDKGFVEPNGTSENQVFKITIPEYSQGPGHIVYTVVTKTNMPQFKNQEMIVKRRFSDFLGLYEKIVERNAHLGVIIPIPPDKNYINSTFIKLSKDNNSASSMGISNQSEFLEHRRVELERFLDRLSRHSYLKNDPSLQEFLQFEGTLPKAESTKMFSSSKALKFMKSFGNTIKSISFQMDDEDNFFPDKLEELNAWEKQLSKLASVASVLCDNHQSLANEVVGLYKSLNGLSEAEEDDDSMRIFKQLGQLYEQLAEFSHIKAQAETIYILDAFRDFHKMITSSKNALNEREKIYRTWKENEGHLNSKRIDKAKAELSNKESVYITSLAEQISEYEQIVDQNNDSFDAISKNLKKEFENFDSHRFNEMKNSFINYLNIMIKVHKDSQQLWASYLSQAKKQVE